ncbi:helix-turn-helix domain-containing protein [Novosphingobium profundi]|nr:helix-turn-helix domain-containing protein [Novosphingobium profundi]
MVSPPPDHGALLNLKQAADFIGVHPNTLRSYVREGIIRGAKLGRDWRFQQADLVADVQARYSAPARMRLSADRKEAQWHSGSVQTYTTSNSQHRTERSLDILLERPTGKRPRNTTTS